ncbi:MAG: VOC family protein [Candidatus Aquirickettsiella gammari]
MAPLFHLSFYVHDLNKARKFYGDLLGCDEGRSTEKWIDFNFFGHQLSLHLGTLADQTNTSQVGAHDVPMPHFGVILEMPEWEKLMARFEHHGVVFTIPPSMRFAGQAGQQATAFVRDPSGNALEFKGFKDLAFVYER